MIRSKMETPRVWIHKDYASDIKKRNPYDIVPMFLNNDEVHCYRLWDPLTAYGEWEACWIDCATAYKRPNSWSVCIGRLCFKCKVAVVPEYARLCLSCHHNLSVYSPKRKSKWI